MFVEQVVDVKKFMPGPVKNMERKPSHGGKPFRQGKGLPVAMSPELDQSAE